jgi:spoIIIJ-associated protein
VTNPMTESATDPGTDPVTDPVTDPAADVPADPAADVPADVPEDSPDAAKPDAHASSGAPGTGATRLEEEGEVAADYLEELLDIADLDGDIDLDVENERAAVSIVTDPVSARALRRLVGPDGEVLEALQELTRLAVQTKTGERSRLMLDVAGYRAGRRTELESVARRAVVDVQRSGEAVRLERMTPFERKVVHDVVAAAGLRSESEGEEPNRRVVVLPVS